MRMKMIEKRKKLNLTQEDMAKLTGLKRSTITNYELGTITPSFAALTKLKKAYQTQDDNIFLITDVSLNNKK